MFRCKSCGALNRVPPEKRSNASEAMCGRCKAPLDLSGAPQDVKAADLERAVSSSPVPVLVDFWAPWCQPCRVASPIVDEVARERGGRLITLKLNTEDEPAAASMHRIEGIPTFAVFRGGREVARRSGVLPKPQLSQWLDAAEREGSTSSSPS